MFKLLISIFLEKIYKMQHLEGNGTPVLYIGRTALKGYSSKLQSHSLFFQIFLLSSATIKLNVF
jgi:hypothetical protein